MRSLSQQTHSKRGTPRMGRSKVTFHSGLRVLEMVGVDSLASPSATTRYCTR